MSKFPGLRQSEILDQSQALLLSSKSPTPEAVVADPLRGFSALLEARYLPDKLPLSLKSLDIDLDSSPAVT